MSNSVTSDKVLFPIMLEIAGFIGSMVGIFLSMYYIDTRGVEVALDQATFWIIESLSLPLAFAGFFFEETFRDGKRYSICNKDSSLVFLAFGITMLILHYSKSSIEAKLPLIFCFIIYMFLSSSSLLLEMISKSEYTRYKMIHILLCYSLIGYACYFTFKFLI